MSRRAGLADPGAARAGWMREFPDHRVTEIGLLSEGHAALVTAAGGAWIVWTMGSDTVARRLAGARARRGAHRLILRFPDWGAPRLALRVTEDEARAILAHLEEDAWALR
ncbi:MAG: hypothetical protein ACLFRZ_11170 [Rhodosalinus sp.]